MTLLSAVWSDYDFHLWLQQRGWKGEKFEVGESTEYRVEGKPVAVMFRYPRSILFLEGAYRDHNITDR